MSIINIQEVWVYNFTVAGKLYSVYCIVYQCACDTVSA